MDVTNETLEKLERLAHYCKEVAEDDCSEKQYARALEPLNAACSPSTILSLCAEIKRLRAALNYYAKECVYEWNFVGKQQPPLINYDKGERARQALAAYRGGGEC